MGGFSIVARQIARWLRGPTTLAGATVLKPSVVVVTDKVPCTKQAEEEARKGLLWLLREETDRDVFDLVSTIEVVATRQQPETGANSHHERLKRCLLRRAAQAQDERHNIRMQYCLTHFESFFSSACRQFSESVHKPFNLVDFSRLNYPPATDLEKHLGNFLDLCASPQDLILFATDVIASSFLLDSYPPGCHQKAYTKPLASVSSHSTPVPMLFYDLEFCLR
ncbi:hypothetical protein LTR10_024369 [Elasticomyces elasticus]|uniref:Uncharacterized protein n=1 Tax=Exophiala sideris TaxID=1016849 RepID=A0ABR0IV06_9EURO|nr:hypothetical protein LTR10_024369 [Elasticomyces elasticus]KAK5021244.1 hypothetical protein LTS07_011159 [Exophiala sideris]KAK5030189.1 hypothetical protein LTR13_008207 [Exophiala sideris]KAK5049153.1 hypothetical protein LTR69_011180 [Exophiala sideris]KAK5176419.1 hypothetical protein LTR44_011041 [Eurotiomycetes sp. CCFEE 6388]